MKKVYRFIGVRSMKNIEAIGENIRLLRLKCGLSQEQLALNAGINTSYIGQIERGEKNPTIKTLDKISSALGVSLLDILSPYASKRGGISLDCHHHQPLTILTPEEIKKFILEVLQDNTNIVVHNQSQNLQTRTNNETEKEKNSVCQNKNSIKLLKDQEKSQS